MAGYYDPKKIRPQRDWCSVLMDERQELIGAVFLPTSETGIEKVTEGVATIVAVAHGTINEKLALAPGQRVVVRSFLKYANPIPNDEKWPSGKPKEYFFISSKDIMAIVDPGIDVGYFSRPSQHAVESVSADGTVKMRR